MAPGVTYHNLCNLRGEGGFLTSMLCYLLPLAMGCVPPHCAALFKLVSVSEEIK